MTAHYWEIGIAMLPEARGHGYGGQAQRLLAEYLFLHTPVHRIEASAEVDNVAEQRPLEKAGGAWRDGVTYSILRTDQ